MEPRIAGGCLGNPLTGAVGRAIVNDQDLNGFREGKESFDEFREVFPFVISGDDD
jgi:hypothetical protein